VFIKEMKWWLSGHTQISFILCTSDINMIDFIDLRKDS